MNATQCSFRTPRKQRSWARIRHRRAAGLLAAVVTAAALTVSGFTATAQAQTAATGSLTTASLGTVSDNAAAYALASTSPDWVSTPGGLQNKSCVHALPAGAQLQNDIIVTKSGQRSAIPACNYARIVRPGSLNGTPPAKNPNSDGWFMASWWDSPTWLRRLYSYYTVPTAPAVTGALNYLFSSFEPASGVAIVQPVLTFGASPSGGGNYWYITSWYVWGNKSVYGGNIRVNAGDRIWGAMEGNTCNSGGGGCHWAIRTVDQSRAAPNESRIDITSASVYNTMQGGVFESYGASGCNMLPASDKMSFSDIGAWGPTFNRVIPDFRKVVFDQECSMNLTGSPTSTTITWKG